MNRQVQVGGQERTLRYDTVDDLEVTLAKAPVVRIDYLIPIVNLSRRVYPKFAEYIKSPFFACAALN